MFRLAALSTLALVAFSAATPAYYSEPNVCSTGTTQCCNSVQPASALTPAQLTGLLDILVSGLNTPIGLDCTPINVLAINGGNKCNAEPVCCSSTNGGVGVGCIPVGVQAV